MPSLIVIGAGGHAQMVISTALAAGFEIDCVLDDNPQRWGQRILGIVIDGPIAKACDKRSTPAVIAIGDGAARRRIAGEFALNWTRLVHPFAYVDPAAQVGEGTVIAAGGIVQPGAVIGKHCVVNTGSSIDHDCRLEDYVTTGPGVHLAGGVHVGTGTLLGVGSCARPGCRIGAESQVGAGAVVIQDLPSHVVAYGVPARIRQTNEQAKRVA